MGEGVFRAREKTRALLTVFVIRPFRPPGNTSWVLPWPCPSLSIFQVFFSLFYFSVPLSVLCQTKRHKRNNDLEGVIKLIYSLSPLFYNLLPLYDFSMLVCE